MDGLDDDGFLETTDLGAARRSSDDFLALGGGLFSPPLALAFNAALFSSWLTVLRLLSNPMDPSGIAAIRIDPLLTLQDFCFCCSSSLSGLIEMHHLQQLLQLPALPGCKDCEQIQIRRRLARRTEFKRPKHD